jgi:hypothetical protein
LEAEAVEAEAEAANVVEAESAVEAEAKAEVAFDALADS